MSESEVKEPDFDADPFLHVDDWAPEPPDETPTDLAYQHDHYLYGIEKIREAEKLGVLEVTHVTEALIHRGWELFQRRPDKDWSLTDCISFVVIHKKINC